MEPRGEGNVRNGTQTSFVPYIAVKVYGGKDPGPPSPIEKAWDSWNMGETPKTLVRSALRPVKARLLRKTPLLTSVVTFSNVPGLESPRACRLSENEDQVSERREARGFSASQYSWPFGL